MELWAGEGELCKVVATTVFVARVQIGFFSGRCFALGSLCRFGFGFSIFGFFRFTVQAVSGGARAWRCLIQSGVLGGGGNSRVSVWVWLRVDVTTYD